MNQLNIFDAVLLGLALFATVSACSRGFAKETLHTMLFLGAVVAGALFMVQTGGNQTRGDHTTDATQAAFLSLNLAYYVLAAYFAVTVALKVVTPLTMKTMSDVGLRARLWAGAQGLLKVICAGLFLNVWYAVHAPDPSPQRLLVLPEAIQNSTLVQLSDGGWTESIVGFLASKGLAPQQQPGMDSIPPAQSGTLLPDETAVPPKPESPATLPPPPNARH